MKKHIVGYYGGESLLQPGKACDYMICVSQDETGEPVELYAEIVCPDDVSEDNLDGWSDSVYNDLKADIISQAEAYGIAEEQLIF